MAMINQDKDVISSASNGSVSGVSEMRISVTSEQLHNMSGMAELGKLQSGQTIVGEVISTQGNAVKIALGTNAFVLAGLGGNIDLQQGQKIIFQLLKEQDGRIALRPLYQNMAQNNTVLKALQAAGFPATEQNMKMVSLMMQDNQPIDKQSLYAMQKECMLNPEVSMQDILALKKLHVPVTAENVNGYQIYQNQQHLLHHSMMDMAREVATLCGDMAGQYAKEPQSQFDNLLKAILFVEESTIPGALRDEMLVGKQLVAGEMSLKQSDESYRMNFSQQTDQSSLQQKEINMQWVGNADRAFQGAQEQVQAQGQAQGEGLGQVPGQTSGQTLGQTLGEGLEQTTGQVPGQIYGQIIGEALGQVLAQASGQASEEASRQVLGQASSQTPDIQELIKLIQSGKSPSEWGPQWKEESIADTLVKHWMKGMSLSPQDFASSKKIAEVIRNLKELSGRILQEADKAGVQEQQLRATFHVKNNVDFLQQVSNFFQYVQAPIRFSGSLSTGELLVYSNKKSLAEEGGEVTALLHLQMPNLGKCDIYLRLKEQQSLETHFYMETEELLTFMMDHMSILTNKLTAAGYETKATGSVREEMESPASALIPKGSSQEEAKLLGEYSFDMRA